MEKILFICVHNSARSQMAEEYLRQLGGDGLQVESAGFEPTVINPLVVEVMKEEGFDLSGKATRSVFDLYRQGRIFNYVITVCDDKRDEECPIYPGLTHRLYLPFPDPEKVQGTPEEQLDRVREIRDSIKSAIHDLIQWLDTDEEQRDCDFWQCKPFENEI